MSRLSNADDEEVTTRGWVLFGAMALIWGVPYFMISVAVEELEPSVVVFGRTALAALILVPIAARSGALRPALRRWRPVLAFAAIEMAGPWILLTSAEQHLASGLAALIIASVPIVGAIVAFLLGDRSALRLVRLAGIGLGLAGVALLVGKDLSGDAPPPVWSVVAVLLVCVGYATAPFIAARALGDVPSIGVIALSLAVVSVVYAPIAAAQWPQEMPRTGVVASVVGLAVICTGLAFVVFFKLIEEIGPTRAGLITFANPVVAVLLGAMFLDEVVTVATVFGFVLVLSGCWLATRPAPVAPGQVSPAATCPSEVAASSASGELVGDPRGGGLEAPEVGRAAEV